MSTYLSGVLSRRVTPQSEPIPGEAMVPNSAGGFAYAVDDWTRLDRFLILGTEGGSYYATQQKLTAENAQAVLRCIAVDGERAVRTIAEVSEGGRAPKNDPAIFALALCLTRGDLATKRAATAAVPRVCRIGTHVFQLASHIDGFKAWNRTTRRAVSGWYAGLPDEKLAYQMVKYQQREGWSHHDLMHLSHPKLAGAKSTLAHWAKKGWESVGDEPHPDAALRKVWAFERAKRAASAGEIASLIREHDLPREAIPSEHLNDAGVWRALLERMPLGAMVRNLGKLTAVGALDAETVCGRLRDAERITRARVHPIALLSALKVYEQGHGERGSLTWTPNAKVVDALNDAFYLAFSAVIPTGKRLLLGLDVSGSMAGTSVAGMSHLSAREACGALALVSARTEAECHLMAFDTNGYGLTLTPQVRLDHVVKTLERTGGGGTDCALPVAWALHHKLDVDAILILTDSETWAGRVHPSQAIRSYREKSGIPAKLVVAALASNNYSVADPNDAGMLNVVGFDTAAPSVIADFVRGAPAPAESLEDAA